MVVIVGSNSWWIIGQLLMCVCVCVSHWAVDVESGNGESGMEHNSTCSMFSVVITLTDEGLDQLCLVITVLWMLVSSDIRFVWYLPVLPYNC